MLSCSVNQLFYFRIYLELGDGKVELLDTKIQRYTSNQELMVDENDVLNIYAMQ